MDSIAGFHQKEKDGKLFFVIHQTQSPTSSVEADGHDHHLQPLFLCPAERMQKDGHYGDDFPLTSSHKYVLSTTRFKHHVVPWFSRNNKKCNACSDSYFGTDYYFCETDRKTYHKECVESPLQIKHPYHPHHPLQLSYSRTSQRCLCCENFAYFLIYCCNSCNVFMHPRCAMQQIPFCIDKPKRHDHPLSFFTRQTSLVCNVCSLLRKSPTYVCVRCNFVAHKNCVFSPHIIKISRHHHRIYYVSSLLSKESLCGVCHQSIDSDYGAYTCAKCSDYVVHSRCALAKDVWDGQELQGIPEEKDYIIQDAEPFDKVSEGVILHFLHDHHLMLEVNMLYDEKKLCQACVLPIYKGKFYSCMECIFILHESCANAPRIIQHGTHPHPLILKDTSGNCTHTMYDFWCSACDRYCDAFRYQCPIESCSYRLDVRCAFISEPFDYKGHEHALFIASASAKRLICQVCKTKCIKPLNCIECDFIICFKCASFPYKVRYKHDEHSLTILWGKEACETYWCEVCERNFKDGHEAFYSCKECCTFLHIGCILGRQPYLKPGHPYKNI